MKQNKKGFVEMPITIVNAVKNLLFNNEGVDLTPIINDLAVDKKHRDLCAISVALAYRGAKIDINTESRYKHQFGKFITRYDYVGHSLIMGVVKVKTIEYKVENGDLVKTKENDTISCYGFDQWETEFVDFNTAFAEAQK